MFISFIYSAILRRKIIYFVFAWYCIKSYF